MCIFEYDEEKAFAAQRAEGIEEGRAEGRAEGKEENKIEFMKVLSLIKKGTLTIHDAAIRLGVSETELSDCLI